MVAGYVMTGGKNSRMGGQKKLFLELEGRTFLEHILEAFQDLPKIYLSVECEEPYAHLGLPMVTDRIAGIGPIGGLYSGLCTCTEEAVFAVACDMPFVSRGAVERVMEAYRETGLPVVGMVDGRVHPLFGIYTKELLPVMREQIENGNYRLMDLIRRAGVRTIELGNESKVMMNINTREEYDTIRRSTENIGRICGGDQ